ILYVTPGYRLIALDARTGIAVTSFGKSGVVDLKLDDDQQMDLITGEIGLHSTPMVAKDVVIVGAAHKTGANPKSRRNEKGYVRGFDVRTGKRLWIFHTIPQPGEFGNDTWEKDSWSYTGNAGVWGQISVDEELGLAYLPVELPTGDYYGGHRPGNGLFGESLVAVDLQTGKRRWHFQLVHHGIWDMDIPCAPILTDITVNGRTIKAVAQPTKQAFLYVLDRETGEPIWPIEERPVPKGDVPGEWYAATQPFPTKPPAYDRQGVRIEDLIDFTPELRAEALTVQGLPLLKPPYARISAIDLNKGEILWQIAHGETPDNVRNNPALKGLTIPRTGRSGLIGPLVTRTLVIAGEGGVFTTPSGQRGAMLRAYNKADGKDAGAVSMPAPESGSPMPYMLNGKQYMG